MDLDFNINAELAAAVWAIVLVIRGLIPASAIDIDGKPAVWSMVLVASIIVYLADTGLGANDAQEVAQIIIDIATITVGAILINGAAVASGVERTAREAVTLGGTTNTP